MQHSRIKLIFHHELDEIPVKDRKKIRLGGRGIHSVVPILESAEIPLIQNSLGVDVVLIALYFQHIPRVYGPFLYLLLYQKCNTLRSDLCVLLPV